MRENVYASLDIGTSKIATLIASQDAAGGVRVLGYDVTASRGVKKGLIVDIDEVIKVINGSLERAEKMAGRPVDTAFIAVGGPHIQSINSHGIVAVTGQNNSITQSDVERVIEAAKAVSLPNNRVIIDVSPREFILDGQPGVTNPVGMSAVRLEVITHIITASTTHLSNTQKVFQSLGVRSLGYVFSGLASAESVLTETEKELGVVLVDIGGGKTDIAVFNEGSLAFSSSLSIGARHITNDIAAGTQVTLEDAEKIKLYISGKMNEKKSTAVAEEIIDNAALNITSEQELNVKDIARDIMAPRIEELFDLVDAEIKKVNVENGTPAGMVITGGGALTGAMAIYARRVTGLPTRIGYPRELSGISDELHSPEYAMAIGLIKLAMQGYGSEKEDSSFGIGLQLPFLKKISDTIREFLSHYKLGS